MDIEEIVVELVLGIFCIFLSYQIGVKGNITLIHSYHYTNLDPKDKTAFTKRMGIGTFIAGIGTFLIPILNLLTDSELGYFVGLCSITFGAFLLIFFIIKYNGKLFSFKKK